MRIKRIYYAGTFSDSGACGAWNVIYSIAGLSVCIKYIANCRVLILNCKKCTGISK